jgi:TrmH family RNA methyltransferase
MITSVHNSKVQWVRGLQARARARRSDQAFVVEGVRLVEEALAAGWIPELVFYAEDLNERGQALVEAFQKQGVQVESVSASVMRAASDTQTPQGILAALRLIALPLPEEAGFVFIPDGVRDPGNLGTILRTCAAAGVDAVFLPPGAVDPYSPKVVRAGMGAHFRLPVLSLKWEEIVERLESYGLRVYLAAAGEGVAYNQADFGLPLALIVGGEAEGAGEVARKLAGERVHIPMPGGMESLNAAIAAGILLFEVVRQRLNSIANNRT